MKTGREHPQRDEARQIGALSAWLLLAIAALCWAGNFVLGRAMHADIPPVAFTFWRWAGAGLVLLPFAGRDLWRHRAAYLRRWPLVLALAATGVCLFHVFVYTALHSTTATNAGLILATTPLVIPVMSYVFDRTPLTGRQALGIALSLVGVGVIIIRGDIAVLKEFRLTEGDLWMLLAVPTWALYALLLRHVPDGWPPLATILAMTGCGLVVLAPLFAWELATVGGLALTLDNIAALAYVSLFASVVAYICWNRGVGVIGATRAGLSMHLTPVFATAMAVVLLGERLHPFHAVGVVLIGLGIVLTATERLRPLTASEQGL